MLYKNLLNQLETYFIILDLMVFLE